MITQKQYEDYVSILQEELVPAMGCTEPIAIAYAASLAQKELDGFPEKVDIEVSGNIIKNVKSVVVPNTGGQRGIAAAAAAGIVAGDSTKQLKVISEVSGEQIAQMKSFLEQTKINIDCAESGHIFDIMLTLYRGEHTSYVRIIDFHTNVVDIKKDGKEVFHRDHSSSEEAGKKLTDREFMKVEDIIEFADNVKIDDIKNILEQQISCNMEIAEEGLRGDYGANIGSVLLATNGMEDVKNLAKAKAAAASDARMNGCELPVVINSGSGNQGITASVPVIVFAKEMGVGEEQMYRALVVSNLITIHLKTGIGRLSAYCGAISAGCGSGAGIAYLHGGRLEEVAHTVVNTLAITSGIICDGAKASCAAKIATAVDAGILGYNMYKEGQQFYGGDGIVKKGIENTICTVGKLARYGMAETDKEILRLMIEN